MMNCTKAIDWARYHHSSMAANIEYAIGEFLPLSIEDRERLMCLIISHVRAEFEPVSQTSHDPFRFSPPKDYAE